MKLPNYVTVLLTELNQHGYEAYVVGGAVRSALLNLPVHDYDLTTSAMPEEIKKVFRGWHCLDTGIRHGTVTVLSDHHPIEITTYRRDSTYEDHRHPDHVEFTGALKEDCQRRDFTINALCYHPDQGILDFFGGRQDLAGHIIRCIGDPEKRFEEDALRILRAVRFASRLSFRIEPETSRVLLEKKDTLSYVSIERINEEFTGTLKGAGAAVCLEDYREVIEVFLPELKKLSDGAWREMTGWLEEERTGRAEIRLALILYALHDREAAMHILKRLKYSNAFIAEVQDLLATADDPISTDIEFRSVLSRMKTDIDTFFAFRRAKDPGISLTDKRRQYAGLTNDSYCWNLSQLEVSGNDLIACGLRGPAIGCTLNRLLDDVIHERVINSRELLLKRI